MGTGSNATGGRGNWLGLLVELVLISAATVLLTARSCQMTRDARRQKSQPPSVRADEPDRPVTSQTRSPLAPGDEVEVVDDEAALKLGTKVLAVLSKGDHFGILEVRGEWVKVQAAQGDRTDVGWVHARHLEVVAPSEP